MNLSTHHNRHGISLLEVLISMGILTVGLVSVLSMIPAGRSQTMKANAYDRGTTLAANAAADLINRGLIRPAGWLSGPTEDKNADGILDSGEDGNGNNTIDATPFAVLDPLYRGSTPIWPRIRLRTDASYAAKSLFLLTALLYFPRMGFQLKLSTSLPAVKTTFSFQPMSMTALASMIHQNQSGPMVQQVYCQLFRHAMFSRVFTASWQHLRVLILIRQKCGERQLCPADDRYIF